MSSKKHLDGIIGPVFQRASEVDWQEVRDEWEESTGEKLRFSFWKGLLLWLFLVGFFVYLQVGFFSLYFSRPYIETKIKATKEAISVLRNKDFSEKNLIALETSFLDLQKSVSQKGQFFVLLSLNPIFESQAIDLSRIILCFDRIDTIKNMAFDYFQLPQKSKNKNILRLKLLIANFYLKEIDREISLVKEPEINFYKPIIKAELKKAKDTLSFINKNFNGLIWALGLDGGERRYLLLFPNNKEERNWGGYSGTYGELKLSGVDYSFFIRDIYYLDFLLRGREELKKPPEADLLPQELLPDQKAFPEKDWAWYVLRNTHTSLDFKTNSERAIWVYENIHKQGSIHGVIALTPNLIIDILKIIGPIEMPDYGVEISSENFRQVIEYKVEVDNPHVQGEDRTKDPKQILADLAPKFLQRIEKVSLSQKAEILEKVLDNLSEKQLLAYFKEPKVQKLIEEFNFAGRLKFYPYDYLAIYSTNLNGRKSSLDVKRKFNLYSVLDKKGLVKNRLDLEFDHQGKWVPFRLGFLEGDVENLVEIAVPKGAVLKKVLRGDEDFTSQVREIKEQDKTIFFFKYHINPGEKNRFRFDYSLQKLADKEWGLYFQKQPGIEEVEFIYNLESAKKIERVEGGLNELQILRTDKEFAIKF